MSKNKNSKKAFSMMELSVTIVVSAVVVMALIKANSLFSKVEEVGNKWVSQKIEVKQPPSGCQGGDIVDSETVPGKIIHIFNTSGILDCNAAFDVEYLIVGGGGGTRSNGGGGGGAGGFLTGTTSITAGSHEVVVGDGGLAYSSLPYYPYTPSSGKDSSFFGLIAKGGGCGGSNEADNNTPRPKGCNGGSGGGMGKGGGTRTAWIATGTAGQGYNGGRNGTDPYNNFKYSSGGGGGAGGAGGNGNGLKGGKGGDGLLSTITGVSKWYAVGGPGSCSNPENLTYYAGATASGGAAWDQDGQPNTGNGAGAWGKNGGSGIVVIRYDAPPSS